MAGFEERCNRVLQQLDRPNKLGTPGQARTFQNGAR